MAKTTLTAVGLQKQGQRLVDSISRAIYFVDGDEREAELLRADVVDDIIRIYVYLDDPQLEAFDNVRLIDHDGDVIAAADEHFTKPPEKAYYVAFKYKLVEVGVDSVEQPN